MIMSKVARESRVTGGVARSCDFIESAPRGVPAILGMATALPQFRSSQEEYREWVAHKLKCQRSEARFLERVFRGAQVAYRYSVLPDFESPGHQTLYAVAAPRLSARMEIFRRNACKLASQAAREALARANVEPRAIDHLVFVTSSGCYSPGPDVELCETLALRDDVARSVMTFMGCGAGFAGLGAAIRYSTSNPGSKTLVVCVELSTIHFRADHSPDNIVASALFGDGAAAAVIGNSSDDEDALVRLEAYASRMIPGTRDLLRWDIVDDAFRITLARRLPEAGSESVLELLRTFRNGACSSWVVHPGGPAVLDRVAELLDPRPSPLSWSRAVLRNVGNTGSSAIFFVLERAIPEMDAERPGMMLGFGPGVSVEAIAFTRGARVVSG